MAVRHAVAEISSVTWIPELFHRIPQVGHSHALSPLVYLAGARASTAMSASLARRYSLDSVTATTTRDRFHRKCPPPPS